MIEKNSSSPVAATPASMNTTPDKPKTASEHRKVGTELYLKAFLLLFHETKSLKHFILDTISVLIQSEDFTFTHESRTRQLIYTVIYFVSLVIQANYGKEEKSQNQRELGAAENSHPGCAQKRCKYSLSVLVIIRFQNCH